MRGLAIYSEEPRTRMVETEGLEDYYDIIGCRYIDIVEVSIGRRVFNLIVDDEGMLVQSPRFTVLSKRYPNLWGLAGTVIAYGESDDRDLCDLTAEDLKVLRDNIEMVVEADGRNVTIHPMLLVD